MTQLVKLQLAVPPDSLKAWLKSMVTFILLRAKLSVIMS